MKPQPFKDILRFVWSVYKTVCIAYITAIIVLLVIFGGDWHISVNFHSLIDLINALKKK